MFKKSVAFHTLGCKLNFSETSTISRQMELAGFEKRAFTDEADIYVINTCSVTDNADKECRQLVRRIQRRSPNSFVVITGCYAQLKPAEIAGIPGVDLVLGASEKYQLPLHLQTLTKGDSTRINSCDIDTLTGFHSSWSLGDRTRSFLKVQDGCDYNCSFCTIPQARGKSRSDEIASVVSNARKIAAEGAKEIVLTGVNLGDFGRGADGGRLKNEDFNSLVTALEEVTEIDRFRISSIEPNLLTEEIISQVAASRRFMPHFHVPLQSGSDEMLGLMRRRYRTELYKSRVAAIKNAMPHACIGVDVIVGHPGETEALFEETFQFLSELDISYLHVFTYSERANTHALLLEPVVPAGVRNERNKKLRNLSFQKMQAFSARFGGTTRKVLFESEEKNGLMEGYTDNYIRVQAIYDKKRTNQITDWML